MEGSLKMKKKETTKVKDILGMFKDLTVDSSKILKKIDKEFEHKENVEFVK